MHTLSLINYEVEFMDNKINLESIILGGGCFWCIEAVYRHVKGVVDVTSGYAGGTIENPTYEQVCTGKTGHAEVVKVDFNPQEISLVDILHIFFTVHDPTTLNRQGNDMGTEYRSIVLYMNEKQKETAKKIMREISDQKIYTDPIVTELKSLDVFYRAEEYQQRFFEKNPEAIYCQLVVAPKVAKFRTKYSNLYN
jgi:peptide-methionine (S)-S-oxide reductase